MVEVHSAQYAVREVNEVSERHLLAGSDSAVSCLILLRGILLHVM